MRRQSTIQQSCKLLIEFESKLADLKLSMFDLGGGKAEQHRVQGSDGRGVLEELAFPIPILDAARMPIGKISLEVLGILPDALYSHI